MSVYEIHFSLNVDIEYNVLIKPTWTGSYFHVILMNSFKYISKEYPSFSSLKVYKAMRNGTSFMRKTHSVYCLDEEKATRE